MFRCLEICSLSLATQGVGFFYELAGLASNSIRRVHQGVLNLGKRYRFSEEQRKLSVTEKKSRNNHHGPVRRQHPPCRVQAPSPHSHGELAAPPGAELRDADPVATTAAVASRVTQLRNNLPLGLSTRTVRVNSAGPTGVLRSAAAKGTAASSLSPKPAMRDTEYSAGVSNAARVARTPVVVRTVASRHRRTHVTSFSRSSPVIGLHDAAAGAGEISDYSVFIWRRRRRHRGFCARQNTAPSVIRTLFA
jgi:hypothetical protein